MSVQIFVEGGGDSKSSRVECRKAFAEFFRRAGLTGNKPDVVACGRRSNAFDRFKTAVENEQGDKNRFLLLVDSEGTVSSASKWEYLRARDSWLKPIGAEENQVYLMVQCMEAWFLADRNALKAYFRHDRSDRNLPDDQQVEQHSKDRIFQTLESVSRESSKGVYGKAKHSFEILGKIDPEKVCRASSHANGLISRLKELLS